MCREQLSLPITRPERCKEIMGKYQVDARRAQIGVIGDDVKVEGGIHFGKTKE